MTIRKSLQSSHGCVVVLFLQLLTEPKQGTDPPSKQAKICEFKASHSASSIALQIHSPVKKKKDMGMRTWWCDRGNSSFTLTSSYVLSPSGSSFYLFDQF